MITKFKKPVAAGGTTIENEPIIKSDGASSDVMQWLSNNEASNITISEDGSNNLDLVVSSGTVTAAAFDGTLGATTPATVAATTITASGAVTGANLNASNGSSSFARTHSTTTASLQILDIKATSSGDMADGFGPSIVFSASDTGTTSAQVAEINAVRAGSDTAFDLEFQTGDATRLTIDSAGTVNLVRASTDPTAGYTTNSQLVIGVPGASTHKLAIARDTDGDNAYIHSYQDGVGAKNLVLQPGGGYVGIGVTPAASQVLQVKVASDVNLSVSHDSGKVRVNAINDAASVNVPMEFTGSSYNFLTGLATFSNGIACSGGGVTTSANFGQIKTSTSTAITSGSTIPISSSNANGSLVTVYEGSSGKVIVFLVSFANVVIISDPGSYGSVTDVSDKFCMLGGGSHTCILKNGFSGDKTVQIMAMGCGLE